MVIVERLLSPASGSADGSKTAFLKRAVPEESRNTEILCQHRLWVGQSCKLSTTEFSPLHPTCGGPGVFKHGPDEKPG